MLTQPNVIRQLTAATDPLLNDRPHSYMHSGAKAAETFALRIMGYCAVKHATAILWKL